MATPVRLVDPAQDEKRANHPNQLRTVLRLHRFNNGLDLVPER
ncbi:MAG: hypothetical protein ABSF54_18715 [Bryobacteraceae bacterium]